MAGSNDNIRFHPMDKLIYEYVAWGNCKVLNPDGTENTSSTFVGNINPIRYRSYYYDTDLGLYYLQTRWYDPEIGRFVNLDQIEYIAPEILNGLNLYAYCLNNPVMWYDPYGHEAISIGSSVVLVGLFLLIAFIIMESQTHMFENAIDYIVDFFSSIEWNFSRNSNSSFIEETITSTQDYEFIRIQAKQKYKPKRGGARVRGKSKKDALEKARARGGGRPPIHHKGKFNKKGEWIGPHYHPNVPEGSPFFHDHYFYQLFLVPFLFEEDD